MVDLSSLDAVAQVRFFFLLLSDDDEPGLAWLSINGGKPRPADPDDCLVEEDGPKKAGLQARTGKVTPASLFETLDDDVREMAEGEGWSWAVDWSEEEPGWHLASAAEAAACGLCAPLPSGRPIGGDRMA